MIKGIGIDVENIDRFRKLVYSDNKIFSSEEINYCLSKNDPYPSFAARFCVKEAFIKASGLKIDHNKIITKMEGDVPKLFLDDLMNHVFHISLSHSKNIASAIVIFEKID